MLDSNFDWADLSISDINTIKSEIIDDDTYCTFRKISLGDVVMDIGASVGPFTKSILKYNPSKIYCIEPSKSLFSVLEKNLLDTNIPIIGINKAIIHPTNYNKLNIFGTPGEFVTDTFMSIIKEYNIENINFLKIDCEGGEYSIFNDESIDYLINNVDYISMEVHLKIYGCRDNFKYFRDNYLIRFKNYKVLSCKYQNISFGNFIDLSNYIKDNNFIDSYNYEFMIYINNK